MHTLKLTIFAICSTVLLFSSCGKDKEKVSGTYVFSSAVDKTYYGYKKENNEILEVATTDIDESLFDKCNQANRIDDIKILSDSKLSYTAYEVYLTTGATKIEESEYTVEDDILSFTFSDEWGNEESIGLLIEGDQIVLNMFAIVDIYGGSIQDIGIYDESPNFDSSPLNARARLEGSAEDGDEVYMMIYKQIYTK